jgi:hypothetical protein
MPDLAEQLRDLVEACAAPVDADEALRLSQARTADVPVGHVDEFVPQFEHASTLPMRISGPEPTEAMHSKMSRRSRRPVIRVCVGGAVAAVVAAVLILQPTPTSKVKAPEAAAAEITRIADVAQPVPPLAPGQWYDYQLQGVLLANVSNGAKTPGGPPINPAQASVPITLEEWVNSTSGVCTSQELGTARFSDIANAKAWSALGLSDTPANQPVTDCSAGAETTTGFGSSFPPIEVSAVTHDPAILALQLQSSSTGIPAVDDYAKGNPKNQAAFERLAVLLVSPASGQWPGFGQEMLKTMALLPGVVSLGVMTSHADKQGLAFTAQTNVTVNPSDGSVISTVSPPTVILDSHSGGVLEVRDMDFPVLSSAAQDFVGSPTASVYSQGASYGVTAQWMDPIGSLSIVAGSTLPAWTNSYHVIEVVPKASATQAEVSSVINPFVGNGNLAFGNQNVPAQGQETLDITIMGTVGDEQTVVSALTASGLFASISVLL